MSTSQSMPQPKRAARPSPLPGARESNAGDDFHFVWAARRAVQTLNPKSDLHRLVVEGVSPHDLLVLEPNGERFLAADLTEYYGGATFTDCDRAVIIQLKYSTRHPDRAWTAARLCEASGSGDSSVIRRLAESYTDLTQCGGSREEILKKASIRLVSNQPADGSLMSTLVAAQDALRTHFPNAPTAAAFLLKRLLAAQQVIIKQLQAKAGLSSHDFTDFLRVLDLTGCGEASRLQQRMELLKEVGLSVSHDPTAALRSLCDLIRNQAQPEARTSLGIGQHDVLAALGVTHKDDLFPAPGRVALPRRNVTTRDAQDLAASVVDAARRQVLAHGDAGVGKTTTVQQLRRHLPPGSILITYDCYGAGEYLDLHAERHSVSRALLQISNELAVECGTPFLLTDARQPQDLLRDFTRRLDAASKIVGQSGGLLVVAIDAADNAVVAADDGRDCFVPHLWKLPLPDNCRLLMLARSHRRDSLQAPAGVVQYELTGFDPSASSAHLRSTFPYADDEQCHTFHERTGHNPRVQSYLLDTVNEQDNGLPALEHVLRNASKTPHEIFEDLVSAAVEHVPGSERAREHLAILVCLKRPIPLSVFTQACGLGTDEAINFIRALRPGVVFKDESITFRDEDFETHLRSRTANDLAASQDRLGTFFLSRANQSVYAAQAVAEHLFQAERMEDVIRLALSGPEPAIITDDLLRLHVRRRRIELAMQSAGRTKRDADGVRLLLLAAELSRADGAVTSLVRANPEMATLHGDPRSVASLYAREENSSWLGPAHLRIAALYARDTASHDRAVDHLRHAQAWFRRRSLLPENETWGWHIGVKDIACGAEAVFYLNGAAAAQNWLQHWRPQETVLKATGCLASSLATRLSPAQMERYLAELQLPLRAECVLLAALWDIGYPVEQTRVSDVLQRLARSIKSNSSRRKKRSGTRGTGEWTVPLCEMAAFHNVDAGRILRVLSGFGPDFPQTIPSDFSGLGEFGLPLRAECLQAALRGTSMTAEDLLPERYRPKPDDKNSYRHEEERRRFNETVGKLLPIHKLRSDFIVRRPTVLGATPQVRAGLNSLTRIRDQYENRHIPRQRTWIKVACQALLLCDGDARHLFKEIADAAEAVVRGAAPNMWLDMADLMVSHEPYRQDAYGLAERAAQYVTDRATPGRERWETLLRCAEAVAPYDDCLCRDFYKRALEAAEDIDDESAHLLEFQAHLSNQLAPNVQGEEGRSFGARLAVLIVAYRPYVSEPASLPWEEALKAICRLDPTGGLALCSRWDEQNICPVGTGIVPVVQALTAMGWMTPQTGLWLLRLAGEHFDITQEAIPLLNRLLESRADRPALTRMLEDVCTWAYRDTPLAQRSQAIACVVQWADGHGMPGQRDVERLRAAATFAQDLRPTAHEDPYMSEFMAAHRAKAAPLLETAPQGILDFEARFEELQEHAGSSEQIAEYLKTLGWAVSPARRTGFLDAVTTADVRPYYASPVVDALHACLHEWQHSETIRRWVPPGISAYIERRLPDLLGYGHNAENLSRILSLPNLPTSRAALVLPGVISRLDTLGPKSLYALAGLLADGLGAVELKATLDWSLVRAQAQIERDGRALVSQNPAPQEMVPSEALAAFLWALWGHADKHVRWRALHAARGILRHWGNEPTLLRELVKLSHTQTAGAYVVDPDFYWMSARISALLLFDRLADDYPRLMAPYAPDIARHALDEDFPHAQIRELGRRAALRIVSAVPDALPAAATGLLRSINQPLSCRWPRQSRYKLHGDGMPHKEKQTRRFTFNAMDTTRYWFDPLSGVFGQPEQDVEDRAERWICDRWGRTDIGWHTDPRGLNERYDWGLRSNSHGSVPRVEDLWTYLEYHAMMCAAGEMVSTLPIAVEEYDDPGCPWEGWISEVVTAFPDCWLADSRRPTPLRPEYWGSVPPLDGWLQERLPADFDAGLGLKEAGHTGEIVVCGDSVYGDYSRRGGVNVVSALVSPQTAQSLIHAMQTTRRHNYSIPINDGPMHSEDGIDEPDFRLQPWLRHLSVRDDAADKLDPLACGVGTSFTTLGTGVLAAMKLTADNGHRSYSGLDGTAVAEREVWSDDVHSKERITESYSYGQRLWVRLDALLRYLRERDMDLILEVVISRNRSGDYGNKGKYDIGKHAVYLLRQDGTLETVAGSHPVGEEHCS